MQFACTPLILRGLIKKRAIRNYKTEIKKREIKLYPQGNFHAIERALGQEIVANPAMRDVHQQTGQAKIYQQ